MASHSGNKSKAPTALIFQRPVAANSSTVLPIIPKSAVNSSSVRLKLSVESSQRVTTFTSASSHQPKNSTILFAPARWPWAGVDPPRLSELALAKRRLPSRITPT